MKKALTIRVYGRVQGVFFRLAAQEKAIQLGLAGVARNEPDGSVLIEAEGEEAALTSFTDWCRGGSDQSWVRSLETSEMPPRGAKDFVIR